jgi:AcrR family transcriptional regulator
MQRHGNGVHGMSDPHATQRQHRRTRHVSRNQPTIPRVSREERERLIVRAAVAFFAEHGFEGQTRELARRLGITQPLLYSYFPNKAALIDRVYREVFLDRWKPQWQAWIGDRSRPLPERLTGFYQDYAQLILSYEWVRLFMFSGLKGLNIAKRYCEVVFARIYATVIGEVRWEHGGPPLAEAPMTDAEVEHLWALHGSIFYLGIRRWIYRLPVPGDQDAAVAARVAAYLDGAAGATQAAAVSTKQRGQVAEAMMQWDDSGGGSSVVDLLSRR